MILDQLKNKNLYENAHPGFDKAFAFLESFVNNKQEVGKYEIDGDRVYAIVQTYDSKLEGKFEAHNEYIDIQFVAEGSEIIEYADRDLLTVTRPYAPDAELYADYDASTKLILNPGSFAIFYPNDGHKPGMAISEPQRILKVVVKIKA